MLSKSQGSVDPHHHVGDIFVSLTLSPTYTQSPAVLKSFVYCRLKTHSECPSHSLEMKSLTRNPRGGPPGWVYRETDRVGAGATPKAGRLVAGKCDQLGRTITVDCAILFLANVILSSAHHRIEVLKDFTCTLRLLTVYQTECYIHTAFIVSRTARHDVIQFHSHSRCGTRQ